jgi:hypothetical protein
MHTNHEYDADVREDASAIQSWLELQFTKRISESSGLLAGVARRAPLERLRILEEVLKRKPALAAAARSLAVEDQFKLTVELVRAGATTGTSRFVVPAVATPTQAARCSARRRGWPR